MTRSLIFGIILILCGCAIIPQDKPMANLREANSIAISEQIKKEKNAWPQARWWTRYNDEQLNDLVSTVLNESLSIKIAKIRLAIAQSKTNQARANADLTIDTNLQATRERTSEHGMYPPPLAGEWITDSEPMLQANYQFDWWGKNEAKIKAAAGEVMASKADEAEAERQLVAIVIQTYFNWQTTQARISLLNQQLTIQQDLYNIAARQEKDGIANNDMENEYSANISNQKNLISKLQTSAAQDIEALNALINSNTNTIKLNHLTVLPLPEASSKIPDNLSFQLLSRRPDLQAALWRVTASKESVKAQKAAFYPDINLRAFFGFSSLSLDQLIKIGSRTYGFTPSISLPIFDSGRLKSSLATARATRDLEVAQYNQTLVHAVQEVANQGINLQGLNEQQKQIHSWLNSIQKTGQNKQKLFNHGLIDKRSLLLSKLPVLNAKEQVLLLKNSQISTEIALTQALGGGFMAQNSSELKN